MEPTDLKDFRCGMVSIVGRPNVGKSTLLNHILKEKVAIVSKVPQTTRLKVRGIFTDQRGQIIFFDTPGLHLAKDALGHCMNASSQESMQDADCIIHLVDSSEPTGREEEMVVERLKDARAPLILGLNKIDLKGRHADQYISLWQKIKKEAINNTSLFLILPLSAKTGYNVDQLLDFIFARLPKGPALYPEDIISDMPQKIAVADIIREKLFQIMRQEVPHSIGVVVRQMVSRKENLVYIDAEILVERESQKEIVIGKNGAILKRIGTIARAELEGLLESKVFLDLHVKSEKRWRDNPSLLEEMGYYS